MMQKKFSRTQLLFGKPAMQTLMGAQVAVFGVGGVGGYVVEVLARSGVGTIDIIDNDKVCETNLNRQIIATMDTIGRYKVDVAEERIHSINPDCVVNKYKMFYLVDNADELDLSKYDYVVDCIDTVSAKIELIRRCSKLNVPIICSMGAAYKLNTTSFKITDLSKTRMDPLAKAIRKRLRKEGILHAKVVYSEEVPLASIPYSLGDYDMADEEIDESAPASNAFVPAAEGIIVGGEVVKDLINKAGTMRITPDKA